MAELSRRLRLEIAIGKSQHAVLRRALALAAGTRERRVRVGSVDIPLFQRGDGGDRDPVVLLHGFGANKESWLLMAPVLARHRPLVIPDLPGYGAATPIRPEGAHAERQAGRVVALLDALGIERAHLVGNSMGAGIAAELAIRRPERVRSLALLGSTGPAATPSEFDRALARGDNPLVPRSLEQADALLALAAARMPPLPRAVRRYVGWQRCADAERLAALFEGWQARPPLTADPGALARISAPTLVVHGELDRVIDPSTGLALGRAIPGAEVRILRDLGHGPQIEAPRRSGALLNRFHARADAEARWSPAPRR